MSTINTTNLKNPSSGSNNIVLDSSGRVLVGTSSATNNLRLDAKLAVVSTGSGNLGGVNLTNYGGTGSGAASFIDFNRSRGTTDGSFTSVASGDVLGYLAWRGATGSGFDVFSQITTEVDGTPGAGDAPGRLVFSTTADGASSPTERMRISQGGKVIVNDTTTILDATFSVLAQSGNNAIALRSDASTTFAALNIWCNESSGNQIFSRFATDSNVARGSIDYNRAAGQVRYNITSDRRLKLDIQPASTALDTLAAIQVRSYKWAETGYQVDHGFIAQELNEIAPDAVKVGDDGEEVTDSWAVDNGKLVPLLTKALQEAIAKIESLEARLTAAGIE